MDLLCPTVTRVKSAPTSRCCPPALARNCSRSRRDFGAFRPQVCRSRRRRCASTNRLRMSALPGQRQRALNTAWRVAPWWWAAALFLIGEWPLNGRRQERRRMLFLQVALLAFGLALAVARLPIGGWLVATAALLRCKEKFGLL